MNVLEWRPSASELFIFSCPDYNRNLRAAVTIGSMGFAEGARRVIIVAYLIILHGVVVWLVLDKYVLSTMLQSHWTPDGVPAPSVQPLVTPTTLPSISPTQAPDPAVTSATPQIVPEGRLLIPVAGVRPEELRDTFSESRSESRVHEAIDIMAPEMTPVIAVADGEIVKFHDSAAGGFTIYQLSADKRYFFYYAHLHSRAPGIAEKQFVTRGTTIGYVGDTGNAGAGNYHLHFSINQVIDPKRFWDGISVNPYPILRGDMQLP